MEWTPDRISFGILVITVLVSLLGSLMVGGAGPVPMQWGFDGKPTWKAPRLIAFSFIPALSFLILCFFHAGHHPHIHTEGHADPLIVSAVLFLVVNILYMAMLRRVSS